jgi:hypothetical protein
LGHTLLQVEKYHRNHSFALQCGLWTDFVDKAKYAYLTPAIALAVLILNIILAHVFYKKEKLAAYFLNFANLAVQLIFLAASIMIIMINAG